MDLSDKIALALFIWGVALFIFGAVECGLHRYSPGRSFAWVGTACLLLCTLIVVFS